MKPKKSISADIREAIGLRAYYIWEREGKPEGRQELHWQMAEAEILSEQPAYEAPHLPPHSQTIMAVPAKKKAAKAKSAKAPAVKASKTKAAKSADSAAKPVVATAKTKKATKAKPAPRSS